MCVVWFGAALRPSVSLNPNLVTSNSNAKRKKRCETQSSELTTLLQVARFLQQVPWSVSPSVPVESSTVSTAFAVVGS